MISEGTLMHGFVLIDGLAWLILGAIVFFIYRKTGAGISAPFPTSLSQGG